MRPDAGEAGSDAGGGAAVGAAALVATTTDANTGARSAGERSPPGALDLRRSRRVSAGEDRSGGGASEVSACPAISARASRRQPNSCCGLRPLRRATSETFAPGLRTLDNNAGFLVVRPPSASALASDQLNPPHRRDGIIGAVGGLRFERMLKHMVKSIAHGPASSHSPRHAEMWGRRTAYPRLRRSGCCGRCCCRRSTRSARNVS